MPKYNLGLNAGTRRKRPKPYVKKPYEKRGLIGRETRSARGFWSNHIMDDVIQMTTEELDQAVDKFLDMFIATQLRVNKRWNFPEVIDSKRLK